MKVLVYFAAILGALLVVAALYTLLAESLNVDRPNIVNQSPENEPILDGDILINSGTGSACRCTYGGQLRIIDEHSRPISTATIGLIFSRPGEDGEITNRRLSSQTSRIGHAYVKKCLWNQVEWSSVMLHISAPGYSSKTLPAEQRWDELKTVVLPSQESYNSGFNADADKAGAG